jgi:uncharacterized protein (TIRG00374 family)
MPEVRGIGDADGDADQLGAPLDDDALSADLHPRHLAKRVVEIVAVIVVVAISIRALPGLGEVRHRLSHLDPVWIVALALAEFGSCAGYVLVFRSTFCPQMSWRLSYDIAMAEQAANTLLPAGGAGGLALGVWALRRTGMAARHIARRTVAFFVVTSAANFGTLIVVGIATFVGVLPGQRSVLLTLVPAIVTLLGAALVAVSPSLLRALDRGGPDSGGDGWRGRARHLVHEGLQAGADGLDQAKDLLRSRSLGVVVGSFSYMAFDIAALGLAFAAVGNVPTFSTLVLAYLIGQLGNLIPLPGGVGGTEGALIGTFALYGVNIADATAAVLIYRLFALLVPAVLGTPAFVLLRRRLMRAEQPEVVCEPLVV